MRIRAWRRTAKDGDTTERAQPAGRRSPKVTRRLRWAALATIVLLGGGLFWRFGNPLAGAKESDGLSLTVPVIEGDLEITVEASGKVAPARSVEVPFGTDGRVTEVVVELNQQVKKDAVLARLDDSKLQLQLQQAQADLKTAEAGLDKQLHGASTPEDLASAAAGVDAAAAQLQKARTGNVTASDIRQAEASVAVASERLRQAERGNASASEIASAEAALAAAQAQRDALSNPAPEKLSAARLALTEAEENLRKTQASGAAAKEQAGQDLEQAANAVRNAQDELNRVYWETHGGDGGWLLGPADFGYQDAINRYNAAVRAEEDARATMRKAEVAKENAIQQDAADVPQAQARVDNARRQLDALQNPGAADLTQANKAVVDAQSHLDQLRNGSTASDIAIARANLAQAQAALDKLRDGGTAADIAGANAQFEQSQAGLDKLTAPAAESDIAIADAGVTQAQVDVTRAELALKQAILAAPFDGIITSLDVVPGKEVSSGKAAATIADTSTIYVDLQISESDIGQITKGQSATLTFDALPDVSIVGTVEVVGSAGSDQQNLVTYPVRIRFDPGVAPVKLGMTASASIVVERRNGVIKVPSQALRSQGPFKTLQVLYGSDKVPVEVPVTTGASDGATTEIVSCLNTGGQCLRPGDQLAIDLPDAPGMASGGGGEGQMLTIAAPASAPMSGERVFITK